jgi:anti-sigma B factor antagonist
MQIDVEKTEKAIIFTPRMQSIDAVVADEFKAYIIGLVAPEFKLVILNMKDVTFIDSTGLGKIIAILKSTHADQRLVLCNIVETVHGIIKLTKLDNFFTIRPSVTSAMQLVEE